MRPAVALFAAVLGLLPLTGAAAPVLTPPDAGIDGLMQAYAEGFDLLRSKGGNELPEDQRFDLDVAEIAEVWRRGSVVTSWLLDLTADALVADPQLAQFSGSVSDSGEGRWTIDAAVEQAVPVPVLSSALFARFRSRQQQGTYGDKILSAMRLGFGGHVEKGK